MNVFECFASETIPQIVRRRIVEEVQLEPPHPDPFILSKHRIYRGDRLTVKYDGRWVHSDCEA